MVLMSQRFEPANPNSSAVKANYHVNSFAK